MTVQQWLRRAFAELKNAHVPTAKLDAELILAAELHRDRTYLHAHDDLPLTARVALSADTKLDQRTRRIPLAYILGYKEFYGRNFRVTPDVLIPRPETETLIEISESLMLPADAAVADIGTGSGAIGITLQLNKPSWHVISTDISSRALAVAQANAAQLGAMVTFREGSLLEPLRQPADLIVANLPYVDKSWGRSPETMHEPALALFADDHGLELIKQLIRQTPSHLRPHGYVLLEADPTQHTAITQAAQLSGLQPIEAEGYGVLFRR